MIHGSNAFDEAYTKLTKEQKQAVDTVEGPVMVLAGPGTGKTHILTLRIANLLRITQATPDSILALTFTDSAARTMRGRLSVLIGEETARKVTITTFHGFAELVRAEYPDAFAGEIDKRLMGDVEETLLLRKAIDAADINILRPPKAPYTYLRDLKSLYGLFSREGITYDEYREWGRKEVLAIKEDKAFQYKKGKCIGELTKAGHDKIVRFDRVEEAVCVLSLYQELKDAQGLIDFSDILTGVIDCIASNESLRSDLQERYQYILADEHQDANASQHKMLELFAYDDHPNIFVVGDEKQAIYRFQGADTGAFKTFTKLFPRTVVINLTSSFRSYQNILDTAHSVVDFLGEHSRLTATRSGDTACVSFVTASDPLDERSRVVALVEKLIKDGVLPHEIAIISRKNKTADLFAQALVAKNLPVLRAGDLSLTAQPVVRALVSLMDYIADPLRTGSLREALLAPWWGVPIVQTLHFLRTTNDKDLVSDLYRQFPETSKIIASCVREALVLTPIATFSYVFTESGARDYFLSHAELIDNISLVRALMMHLENVVLLTEATMFAEAFRDLTRAREHGLSPVKVSLTEREGFITVITAHKAKGMEFKYVIVPDCTENTWEKNNRSSTVPTPFDSKQTIDDARRLFYVALTRAKDYAYLFYARTSDTGRDRLPTLLMPKNISEVNVEGDILPVLHATINAPKKIYELVEQYLEREGLSPSAVNEYLESPATFFVRRVLRIHEPPTPPLVYGSAIHVALATALSGGTLEDSYVALSRVFARSLLVRDLAFEKLRSESKKAVGAVFPELEELGEPVYVEKGFSMEQKIDGVPVILAGKIDAVFKKDGKLVVADFKTGTSVSAKNEAYARQLALYTAMLFANREDVSSGLLLGISDKGIKKVSVPVGKQERENALKDMDTVVRELRSGKWRRGALSEYDAILKLLED